MIYTYILVAVYLSYQPASTPEYKAFPAYKTRAECEKYAQYLRFKVTAGHIVTGCLKSLSTNKEG